MLSNNYEAELPLPNVEARLDSIATPTPDAYLLAFYDCTVLAMRALNAVYSNAPPRSQVYRERVFDLEKLAHFAGSNPSEEGAALLALVTQSTTDLEPYAPYKSGKEHARRARTLKRRLGRAVDVARDMGWQY